MYVIRYIEFWLRWIDSSTFPYTSFWDFNEFFFLLWKAERVV